MCCAFTLYICYYTFTLKRKCKNEPQLIWIYSMTLSCILPHMCSLVQNNSTVCLKLLTLDSCFVSADGGSVILVQQCHRTTRFQSIEMKETEEKERSTLHGTVEDNNNIVNQMWLFLLLLSKPWHLPPLVNREGGFLQTCCHKHTIYKTACVHYTLPVCTGCTQKAVHLLQRVLLEETMSHVYCES